MKLVIRAMGWTYFFGVIVGIAMWNVIDSIWPAPVIPLWKNLLGLALGLGGSAWGLIRYSREAADD